MSLYIHRQFDAQVTLQSSGSGLGAAIALTSAAALALKLYHEKENRCALYNVLYNVKYCTVLTPHPQECENSDDNKKFSLHF